MYLHVSGAIEVGSSDEDASNISICTENSSVIAEALQNDEVDEEEEEERDKVDLTIDSVIRNVG